MQAIDQSQRTSEIDRPPLTPFYEQREVPRPNLVYVADRRWHRYLFLLLFGCLVVGVALGLFLNGRISSERLEIPSNWWESQPLSGPSETIFKTNGKPQMIVIADGSVYQWDSGTLLWSKKGVQGEKFLSPLYIPDIDTSKGQRSVLILTSNLPNDGVIRAIHLWETEVKYPERFKTAPVVTDFRDDELLDLVIATEKNEGTGKSEVWGISGANGDRLWKYPLDWEISHLGVADFNDDHVEDVIAWGVGNKRSILDGKRIRHELETNNQRPVLITSNHILDGSVLPQWIDKANQ